MPARARRLGIAVGNINAIDGGITAPAGFRASGLHCGIKASGKPDLSLVVSDAAAQAAGVFTLNLAKAAPLLVCEDHLAATGGRARAIITNSGCANACTGPQGMTDAREMAALTAAAVGCDVQQVLVLSTGVIGVNLKMDKLRSGIPQAVAELSEQGGAAAARGIMTTDPFPKEYAVEVRTDIGSFRVGGMAKGSGMIEPRMATMLGYLTTDATVDPVMLSRVLSDACRFTFNAITVDGEPSTNDCVLALANGASGVEVTENLYPELFEAFRTVAHELALGVVRGGEGATKLIAITTTGAATDADAWMAARAIANSPLVKTAVHGGDPNWGRLVAAAGRSGAAFVLDGARVQIGSLVLFENGRPFDELAPQAADYLTGKDIAIEVNLGTGGTHRATVWTCDLSAEYVKINAEYRT
ncbi:MAG: bifunctional glutamate N-acetyltransferase/amino-acid acetyltransferase ArgJ [Acidobacteria bacterium]|nr:bifunctional glutamate N-acetyltransferase/amino-acid acetyltransferase ArgJ [Acidobacteriota bacterium]MSO61259.1 bifunctional glutamate N-acetyltransferase/amino-acid acetyltransferase ArgJ [Acidobacteriota bacterium]